MLKKNHILYTIPNFDTAGSGKVVYDLANKIDKKKFNVSIACRHNRGAFYKEIEKLGIPIHIFEFSVPLRPYFSLISRLKPFKDFLEKEDIDIVHSWNWSSEWTEALACRLAGVKFVYTKKAMGWGSKHWKIRSYLSHFIVTVNTDMRAFFGYKKQQELIPFGLDTDYYNVSHFPVRSQDKNFKIVTVANLVPVKGIETLIEAIKSLRHLSITLDIIGDTNEPYAEVLKKMIKDFDLEDSVYFAGKLSDVRASLAASDLYVIPSKQEGMPMALVEAMAMAVPVLGSDISGINYVLRQFPELLFPVSDSEILADKIKKMYHTSFNERLKLGESLSLYCNTHFSMDTFINKHEDLYFNLINRV